jgi:hypothetical protein
MYAQYVYKAGSTKANVLADIVALLTGETNKANLSADCVQANTEILTTESVAGWTLHDAAAATNRVVLSAPCEDALFTKYFGLDFNGATLVYAGGASTWDAGAHTGTECVGTFNNPAGIPFTQSANNFNLANGGTIIISASARHIYLAFKSTGTFIGAGITEFAREGPNETTTYPNWAILTINGLFVRPINKNHQGAGDAHSNSTANSCFAAALIPCNGSLSSSTRLGSTTFYTIAGAIKREAITLQDTYIVHAYATNYLAAPSGNVYNIIGRMKMPGFICLEGADQDTAVINGKNYFRVGTTLMSYYDPLWLLMG